MSDNNVLRFELPAYARLQYDQDPADYMDLLVKLDDGSFRRYYVAKADLERNRNLPSADEVQRQAAALRGMVGGEP